MTRNKCITITCDLCGWRDQVSNPEDGGWKQIQSIEPGNKLDLCNRCISLIREGDSSEAANQAAKLFHAATFAEATLAQAFDTVDWPKVGTAKAVLSKALGRLQTDATEQHRTTEVAEIADAAKETADENNGRVAGVLSRIVTDLAVAYDNQDRALFTGAVERLRTCTNGFRGQYTTLTAFHNTLRDTYTTLVHMAAELEKSGEKCREPFATLRTRLELLLGEMETFLDHCTYEGMRYEPHRKAPAKADQD